MYPVKNGGITEAPASTQVDEIKVTNWAPQSTIEGQGFMVQPGGDSAIWFEFTGQGNANNIEVWFGDQKLTGVAILPNKGGSAQIPPKLYASPKEIPVYLVNTASGKKIGIGTFVVTAKPK